MRLTKLKEHTGVIVGLFLPEQAAQQIYQLVQAAGVANPEPAEDYHITLAYLGDAAALADQRQALQQLVVGFAELGGPIVGVVSGLGRFNNEEGDGTQAVYASFDSPGLAELRQQLLGVLASQGMEVANNHGFTPHITLAYVPAEAPTPALAIPPLPIAFPELTLAWGEERYQAQLMPASEPVLDLVWKEARFQTPDAGATWYTTQDGHNWQPVEIGEKAANYAARAGENITDLLKRGGDGKFTSAAGSAIEAESRRIVDQERQRQAQQPKGSSRRGASRRSRTGRRPAPARPSKAEQQQANHAKVLAALGDKMSPAEYAALLAFNAGEAADQEQLGELIRTGLVERDPQGNLRMTEAGRAFAAAADRGDTRDALDALSRGQERTLAPANDEIADRRRDEARQEPNTPRAPSSSTPRRSEPRSSGGRGGGGSTPKPAEFSPELAAAAAKLSAGQRLRRADQRALITNGLARRDGRKLVLTAAGLRAARQAAQKEYLRGALMVYKDARGVPRWLSATTTAFEDRETEILALAALTKDVERSYRTGQHGPLRFWHLGRPDALDPAAPWGPGIDIGDCDWRCVAGKTLFEGGTFRRPEYAALVRKGDQMSPGFFYPFGQPRRMAIAVGFTGKERTPDVFEDIFIFERSIVPAGRASNPFTRIATKEVHMIPDHKKQEYLARGGDPELLERLLTEQGTAEKEAQARGVAFKEGPGLTFDEAAAALAAMSGITSEAAGTQLKQFLVRLKEGGEGAAAVAEPQAATEPATDTEPTQEAAAEEPLLVGDLTPDEFVALQAKGHEPLLAELRALNEQIGGLGLTDKMRGVLDEFKSTMGTFAAKKDAEDAETAEQLRQALKEAQTAAQQAQTVAAQAQERAQALDARLKELEGDQPTGLRGYRASADPRTVITEGHRLKEGQPGADPLEPHVQGAMSAIQAATGAQPPRG